MVKRFYEFLGQKDMKAARSEIERALEAEPHSSYLLDCLSLLHQQCGELGKGEDDLTRALTYEGKNPDLWYKRGWIRHQQGKLKEALSDLDRALEIDPNSANPLAERAGVWRDLGERAKARQDLDKAVEIDSMCLNAWNNRAMLRFEDGDKSGALVDIQKALSLAPKNQAVIYNLSIIKSLKPGQELRLRSTGYVQGSQWRDTIPEAVPNGLSALQYYKLGVNYSAAGWCEHARECLARSIKLDPTGQIGKQAKQYKESHLPIVAVVPEALTEYRRAKHLADIGNLEEAKNLLSDCIEKYPGFEWAYAKLGALYAATGSRSEAKLYLQKAIKINPKFATAWLSLAQIYEIEKQEGLRQECLKEATRWDSENFRPETGRPDQNSCK